MEGKRSMQWQATMKCRWSDHMDDRPEKCGIWLKLRFRTIEIRQVLGGPGSLFFITPHRKNEEGATEPSTQGLNDFSFYSILTATLEPISTMSALLSFPVITIFAREFLEGGIIIGEYRTIILRGDSLQPGISKEDALKEVTLSSLFAGALAFLVIAAVAIPLAVLSMSFDTATAKIIEGVSKIVAAISLLQLSLKLPKFLGIYESIKKKAVTPSGEALDVTTEETDPDSATELAHAESLTIRSIRFNVAWNIWREVAECGVFLIPFFLSGQGLVAIPLSALIGSVVGIAVAFGIYFANRRLKNKNGLAIFAVLLLAFLSAGLFAGGCHNLESVWGTTTVVWHLQPEFWSVNRLPMTLLKPFGYNDTRTVLEIISYWSWLVLSCILHHRKYRLAHKLSNACRQECDGEKNDSLHSKSHVETIELGDSSIEGSITRYESSIDGDTRVFSSSVDEDLHRQSSLIASDLLLPLRSPHDEDHVVSTAIPPASCDPGSPSSRAFVKEEVEL